MTSHPGRSRTALAAASGLLLALVLTACGGSSGGGHAISSDPATALAAAKKNFDAASSVHLTMATGSKPTKGDAVLGADGTLTHQPAFKGSVKATLAGIQADVPIIAVDGKVYAQLPFSKGYSVIDPAEYNAPDPATFADSTSGISGLLTKLAGATKSGQKRDGKQIVTTFTGTLPGSLVAPIIPSAKASGTYRTEVGIDGDGRIATLRVTGGFFPADGDVTYDLSFDDYGKDVTITKP